VTVSFIGGGNLEYPEKTTDLPQVTWQTLSHNVVSSTPRLSGIRTHNVSGTWGGFNSQLDIPVTVNILIPLNQIVSI
jgi:hypothetical protein